MNMTLNDLLQRHKMDPSTALVPRHHPRNPHCARSSRFFAEAREVR